MQNSEIRNLKVAVIGGGFGGAAATVFLDKLGADVHLYEQAPATGEVGAGIGMRPPTVEAFRAWGIFDAMASVSSASDYFEILTGAGEPILREEWPKKHEYAQENKTRLIHRADFIDTFINHIPAERLHLGHKMVSVTDHGDSATVTFDNGREVTADLVISAEGIRSTVRAQLFADVQPVFAHAHAHRAVISADDTYGMVTDDNFRMYQGDNGSLVYFLPLRHRNQVSFDITAPSDDDSWRPDVTVDQIAGLLDGFDERLQRIARNLDPAAVTSRGVYDIDPIDTWHSDSVVLIGDAAHAMLHHQGQGANQTVQDSSALAEALQESDSVQSALALYQSRRKPTTDALQRVSREEWDSKEGLKTAFPEKASID
ncbi:FAD-dependent oxidoreductase [Haloactinomyces albus]|uniref:Salicylate hydroxylase n=1 Tax=Haloactinomyces albus TaxID=1352928 RepID=A0AAE3ZG69_9ACTN|nr:NAD(P)/FAD-dependent oxidoreductase [Haloactinomyces albus]MDR7303008.1 salicylate hydroxylase [Haloactinomyces albus]